MKSKFIATITACTSVSDQRVHDLADQLLALIDSQAEPHRGRVIPTFYVRDSDVACLSDSRIAGRGAMLHKARSEGMTAYYAAPEEASKEPALEDPPTISPLEAAACTWEAENGFDKYGVAEFLRGRQAASWPGAATPGNWQQLAANVYQAAGAYDLPERFMDALSAASQGELFAHLLDGLLPIETPRPDLTGAKLAEDLIDRIRELEARAAIEGEPVAYLTEWQDGRTSLRFPLEINERQRQYAIKFGATVSALVRQNPKPLTLPRYATQPAEDYAAAVKFYVENPTAALADFDVRMGHKTVSKLPTRAAYPWPQPELPRVIWPKGREAGRMGDMTPRGDSHLRVGLDADNDIYVAIYNAEEGQPSSIEFCTPTLGGGQSPRTREALIAVMVAMEADNAETPGRAFPPITKPKEAANG